MDEKDLRIQTLKEENKKLAEELEKYKQLEKKMYEKFEGHINTETIVNSFIDFYDMQEVNEELAECLLLTNENAKKYKEYQRLEEQGLLLKFPCKVGDVVWFVGNKYVNDYEIRRFIVDNIGIDAVQVAKTIEGRDYWNSFSICDFGKTVFLTEQEAQSALEKMKGD